MVLAIADIFKLDLSPMSSYGSALRHLRKNRCAQNFPLLSLIIRTSPRCVWLLWHGHFREVPSRCGAHYLPRNVIPPRSKSHQSAPVRGRYRSPRDSIILYFCRQFKQDISNNNAGMIASHMGELMSPCHITNSKNAAVGGA